MRLLLLSLLLLSCSLALAGQRTDVVIEAGKLQLVTCGKYSISIGVKTEADKVLVTQGGYWKKIMKVSGFATNDTNRTLIISGFGYDVYYVDDVGTPAGKVKLAFIAN